MINQAENRTPEINEHLLMFIIDVLRYDVGETVQGILELINDDTNIGWRRCWPHDFTEGEVLAGLKVLSEKKLVRPLFDDPITNHLVDWDDPLDFNGPLDKFRFRITELGWTRWNKWNPPEEKSP